MHHLREMTTDPSDRRRAVAISDSPGPPRQPECPDDSVTGLGHVLDEAADAIEHALHFPEGRNSRWRHTGLSRRGERYFNLVATAILLTFVAGWGWAITDVWATGADATTAPGRLGFTIPGARIAAALTEADAPSAAYLTQAAISALAPARGRSGRLQAVIRDPGEPLAVGDLPDEADIAFAERSATPTADSAGTVASANDGLSPSADSARVPVSPGIWGVVLRAGQALAPVTDFAVITRRPLADRRRGRVGLYFIGTWPTERTPHEGYRTPTGFVEVTRENRNTRLSDHFRLKDFLTHGQEGVWPKYLVIDMRLVDKLELILDDLAAHGVNITGVRVMSGFRTPQYNATGGLTDGRATLSRHMYGDAADIFLDSSGNGVMDDLNGDGRVDVEDARVVAAAAERVERRYPSLVGGVGIYRSGPGHGPFVHIDTRGYRARW